MKRIVVEVKEDHLELLSRAKPMAAMAELIWNALDAEATEVRVEFIENELGGEESIRIRDNGHGLDYEHAGIAFRNLGGSWKRPSMRSGARKRTLHGQYGKGRFRAFALGNRVEWASAYAANGSCKRYGIVGRAASPGEFEVSDPAVDGAATPGMLVAIDDLASNVGALRGVKATQEVTELFAPYLRQYPDVRIFYDGVPLDPANAEETATEYDLGELVMENGERINVKVSVVEWSIPGKRGMILCDENGFALHPVKPRLLFRGFSYTAYVKSAHIAALEREGLLDIDDMVNDVRQIVDAARVVLRKHFSQKENERSKDLIEQWQESGVYPYSGTPENDDEARERRILNVYATHVNQSAVFSDASPASKRFVLRLLRELVHKDPIRVARVIDELVTFPEEKAGEVLAIIQS